MNPKLTLYGSLVALGVVLGVGLGWELWKPKAPKVESPAAAIRQKDQSLVLERKPESISDASKEMNLPILPRGSKVERVVKVEVLPKTPSSPMGVSVIHGPGVSALPKPIEVDLTLVGQPDGGQRVIASSPNGDIVGGLDIPTVAPKPIKDLHWQAGVLYNPSEKTYGGYVQRTLGPLVVGAQVLQERLPVQVGGGTKLEATISVGIRF